jgi:NitT/TauT family transport system substrate-binding protein
MYGAFADHGLSYADFEMRFFSDHFTMSDAFIKGEIDVVSHIEPYVSKLVDEVGAVVLAKSSDVWGEGSAECVTSFSSKFLDEHPKAVKAYIRAMLKADRFIKEHPEEALRVLEKSKVWKVSLTQLAAALRNQPPGVDLLKSRNSMSRGVQDMVKLGYVKILPENVIDLSILKSVLDEK